MTFFDITKAAYKSPNFAKLPSGDGGAVTGIGGADSLLQNSAADPGGISSADLTGGGFGSSAGDFGSATGGFGAGTGFFSTGTDGTGTSTFGTSGTSGSGASAPTTRSPASAASAPARSVPARSVPALWAPAPWAPAATAPVSARAPVPVPELSAPATASLPGQHPVRAPHAAVRAQRHPR
ncbi:hypothetical protein ACFQ9X_00965 [Catenulispora yoronensis]